MTVLPDEVTGELEAHFDETLARDGASNRGTGCRTPTARR